MKTDLLIIGSGPAGLTAAIEATKYGCDAIIVDEAFSLGGQLKQQTQFLNDLPKGMESQRGTTLAKQFIAKLDRSKVKTLLSHTMVGKYANGNVGVTDGKNTFPIEAKQIIIATGAAEKAKVFPGWTRPGVMTVGAAQILLNREHVRPGKNAFIIGSNRFSLQVALQLMDCGVNVKGIVEEKSQLINQDEELIEELERRDTPIFYNSFIVNTLGKGSVNQVVIEHQGKEETYDVDLVCIGNGLSPIIEPFEMMDCELTFQKELGGWLPAYNEFFRTSNKSVHVAGNAAGVTSMGAIILTGKIAAINALRVLNKITDDLADSIIHSLWQELYELEIALKENVFYARCSLTHKVHEQLGLPISNPILKRCLNG